MPRVNSRAPCTTAAAASRPCVHKRGADTCRGQYRGVRAATGLYPRPSALFGGAKAGIGRAPTRPREGRKGNLDSHGPGGACHVELVVFHCLLKQACEDVGGALKPGRVALPWEAPHGCHDLPLGPLSPLPPPLPLDGHVADGVATQRPARVGVGNNTGDEVTALSSPWWGVQHR